jgi:hypothetical protein
MQYLLCILLAAGAASAAWAGDRIELAQTGTGTVQPTVVPPPQLLPGTATSTTCIINCDTSAMICQNTCVGPTAQSTAGGLPNTAGNAQCNLNCTSQQLVCKQGCTR